MTAIITNEEFNLLDNNGNKIKTFQGDEIVVKPQISPSNPMFGFEAWGLNSIWLASGFSSKLTGLAKINKTNYAVTKYDLWELPTGPEFAINIYREKIAFSNYPAMYDADSSQEYAQSGAKVNLIVYDLNSKSQQTIATSITKKFQPKWVDADTLEYNNPSEEGRVTKEIP